MADLRTAWRSRPEDAAFRTWTARDGLKLRRMDWAPPAGVEARGSLLFAGGRGDFIEKYLEAYAHWRALGWRVTAFDWRGQGLSRGDIVGGNVESFDPWIDDFAGLIEAWRGEAPGPYAAIAHSLGGHLLLRTIVERAPALDAAVLVAPMIDVNSGGIPPWLAPWLARAMCLLGQSKRPMWKATPLFRPGSIRQRNLTGSLERYADEIAWWEAEPGVIGGPPDWAWLCAAFRSARAFRPERLAKVHTPILLIGTERDKLVSPDAIRRAAAALPHAELMMFDDSAHEILRESDPIRDAALARIDAFLAEHG